MERFEIGDTVVLGFKGSVCQGQIVGKEDQRVVVSFVYNPGDGRAPESVMYTLDASQIIEKI